MIVAVKGKSRLVVVRDIVAPVYRHVQMIGHGEVPGPLTLHSFLSCLHRMKSFLLFLVLNSDIV